MLIIIITHFQNVSFDSTFSTLHPNIASLVLLMLVNDPILTLIVVKLE